MARTVCWWISSTGKGLIARRAEVTALAGKGHQIFMAAVITADAGETVVQTAAVEIAKDGQPDLRPQIPETGLIPIQMHPLQFLEKVLDTAVIAR